MKTELIICTVSIPSVAAKRTAICKLASLSASFACVSVFGMSLVNLPPSSSSPVAFASSRRTFLICPVSIFPSNSV